MSDMRLYPALLIAVGLGALATAYTAQYGFGLEPCILCLYQRVPFAIAAVLGIAGLMYPQTLAAVFALAALAFGVNSAIAVYHVGVEQHWWASAVCGGHLATQINTQDLLAALDSKPEKSCDAVDWTFLGISMAGWNVVFSGALAGLSAYVLKTRKWARNGGE